MSRRGANTPLARDGRRQRRPKAAAAHDGEATSIWLGKGAWAAKRRMHRRQSVERIGRRRHRPLKELRLCRMRLDGRLRIRLWRRSEREGQLDEGCGARLRAGRHLRSNSGLDRRLACARKLVLLLLLLLVAIRRVVLLRLGLTLRLRLRLLTPPLSILLLEPNLFILLLFLLV